MPFRRSFRPRRRRRRRTRRMLMRRTRRVRLAPERKVIDVSALSPLNNAGEFNYLNLSAQGVGSDQRIGAQQLNVSVAVRFTSLLTVGGSASAAIRLMLVLDKQPNGVAFTLADLFQTPTVPVNSFLLPATMGRFRVLRNIRMNLGPAIPERSGQFFKRVRIPSRYSGFAAGIADIQTNALVWLILSDEAVAGNNPTISWSARVSFTG